MEEGKRKVSLERTRGEIVSSGDGQVSKCRIWKECLEKVLRT